MQDLPGAPGTARQGRTRIIVSTNDGGKATQPRAPGHERPRAAQRAARHGRLSAALRAPGADVPLAMTAGAPGQHCLSAAPRAPGHERPLAAQRAAGRDRLSAALRPGRRHRVLTYPWPLAGHVAGGAGSASSACHCGRGAGQHRLRAMANATVSLPAGLRRLRQECLPRVPANPRTLTYPHSQLDTAHNRESGNPRPPVATGGPPGGYAPATRATPSQTPTRLLSRSTTHQVHPVIQVPPHPRSCSTACTGFLRQHPSRAPPRPSAVPLHSGGTKGSRSLVQAQAGQRVPFYDRL